MRTDVVFENGDYGLRGVVKSHWSEAIGRRLQEKSIAALELNHAKGWRGDDLSFLAEFSELRAFKIIDLSISSVEPVHQLRELRSLDVITYCKTELRFSTFPNLERCALEWRPKAVSVSDCKTLKKLFVNRYDGGDVESFARLRNLESLSLLNAPIENLHGLRTLKCLRSLRLANLRKLSSLEGIEGLTNLEELEIHTCRSIGTIEAIASLTKLRTLDINNDGAIASLKPLEKLGLLERVTFYESTNILDGDLSPLEAQKHLSRVAFKNRSHYSTTSQEVRGAHATLYKPQ